MAESLVTQVKRDSEKTRKPSLVVTVEEDEEAKDSTPKALDTPARSKLGRIFSRQYTPTVPKKRFFGGRNGAQSPRSKKKKLPTTQEEPENKASPPTLEKRSSIWNVFRNAFGSEETGGSRKRMLTEEDEANGLLGRNPTNKKHCLVLDLDETLVHSSFQPVKKCDFVLSINMDGIIHKVYVLKRPGCDEFLEEMSKYYELVIFTASLDKYANPLLDLLDPKRLITGRLFRNHCTRRGQTYVKDLDRLGRNLSRTLIIDNSPYSYALHPFYAVPILSWYDDEHDVELFDMMDFLCDLTRIEDVSDVLDATKPWRVTYQKLKEQIKFEEHRRLHPTPEQP